MVKQENQRTEVIFTEPERPAADAVERAAKVIRAGGLVAFPTETVYGLGANALDADAVAGIFEAKGRPPGNPLIVHVSDVDKARDLTEEWPELATRLVEAFWPGPLTLVVKKRAVIPDIVTAGGETVAVRSPAHPVAAALIEAAGVPVAAPSANRSTRISPTTAEHVLKGLNGRIDLILDGGPTPGGIESTVLDVTQKPAVLLRLGPVSRVQIEGVIGPVQTAHDVAQTGPSRSPGMMDRHYAPTVPVEIVEPGGLDSVVEHAAAGHTVGWMTLHRKTAALPGVIQVTMPAEPDEYGQRLYAVLHELDDLAVDRILVECPPDRPEWSAIRDRLQRATARARDCSRTQQ